jgi:hypothetical protein
MHLRVGPVFEIASAEMNVGPNKGRRLRLALARFAAVLIEEARDITGFSYERLDEALGLPQGQSIRYSRYNKGGGATRAPQAAGIQELENRVAKLLGRLAHTVVVENNAKIADGGFNQEGFVAGCPKENLDLREYKADDFQLGYEGDWPTYRRLKYDPSMLFCEQFLIHKLVDLGMHDAWPEMLKLYSWQWGVLWDRGLPWLQREAIGVIPNTPVHAFLPEYAANAQEQRASLAVRNNTVAGRELLASIATALPSRCPLCETS